MPNPFMMVPVVKRMPRFVTSGSLIHSFCARPSFGGRNGLNEWLEQVSRCVFVLVPAIGDNDLHLVQNLYSCNGLYDHAAVRDS